jgi:uncharacterized membrane-anchored protein
MLFARRPLLLLLLVLSLSPALRAYDDKPATPSGIEWHKGPYHAQLGAVAEVDIPKGYAFTDSAGTRRFMELTHNPSSDSELGLVIPVSDKDDSNFWFMLFDFDEIGYVSDSEKTSLDADKILDSLKKNTERGNELRKAKGWSPFHLIRWEKPPFYDEQTHNLTWATLGNSDDPKEGETVNYSTRILGRRGAMSVDLVIDPKRLDEVLPASQELLRHFNFSPGSRYSEFVKGDKVASYGLTALIAGGAAAAAVKTGLFAKLLAALLALKKLLIVILVAIGGTIKRFFAKLKSLLTGKKDIGEQVNPTQASLSEPSSEVASIVSTDHDDRP